MDILKYLLIAVMITSLLLVQQVPTMVLAESIEDSPKCVQGIGRITIDNVEHCLLSSGILQVIDKKVINGTKKNENKFQPALTTLELEISLLSNRVLRGDYVQAKLSIINTGKIAIDACLGEYPLRYTLVGPQFILGDSIVTSHPSCITRFTLLPGQKYNLLKDIKVDVRRGEYVLEGYLEILDPNSCGVFGCGGREISSNSKPVLIVSGS